MMRGNQVSKSCVINVFFNTLFKKSDIYYNFLMKIKYGLNGTGKTKYKENHQGKPTHIVLNSVVDDWTVNKYTTKIEMTEFARVEVLNNSLISEFFKQIQAAQSKTSLSYSGTNTEFKNFYKTLNIEEEINNLKSFDSIVLLSHPHPAITISNEILNEDAISVILSYVSDLSEQEKIKIIGATKFFAALKAKKFTHSTENFISELSIIYVDAEKYVSNLPAVLSNATKNGDEKLVELLLSSKSATSILTIVKSQIVENIKFVFGDKLRPLLVEKEKFSAKTRLNVTDELKKN